MNEFLKYFALDWIDMALSLLAVYLLGNKKRIGFITFGAANIIWVILGFSFMSSLGIAIGNLVFLIMNIRGYISWSKND